MRAALAGGVLAACLATAAGAATLAVLAEDGAEIARLEVPEGGRWCLHWHHSVAGFPVADCFRNDGGRMVLSDTRMADVAAGLGEVPGRGRMVAEPGGGYRIEGIDMPVPGDALPLRVGGPAVDHRLRAGAREIPLTALAAHRRVTIVLRP